MAMKSCFACVSPGKPLRGIGLGGWRRAGVFLCLAAAPFLLVNQITGAEASLIESQVKAAYLFNFLKFVEWPVDAPVGPEGRWVIGIVGDSPVGAELSLLAERKTVEGRGLLVRRLHARDNLSGCDILFVSASEEKHLPLILSGLQGSSVLTVADFGRFIERGGMIQFVTEGDRVRMDIDLGATSRARLKVSSKLLALAQAVTETVKDARN